MPILLRVDPGWGIREVCQTTLGPKENKRELRSIRIISIPRPFVNPISLFLTMLTHFLPLGLPNFVPHFVSPKGDLRRTPFAGGPEGRTSGYGSGSGYADCKQTPFAPNKKIF